MSNYHIVHITKYTYPSAVTDSANQVILYPKSNEYQEILAHKITTKPAVNIDSFDDYFGNQVGFFTIVEPHTELEIRVDLHVATTPNTFGEQTLSAQQQEEELLRVRYEYPFMDFLQIEQMTPQAEINTLFDSLHINSLDTTARVHTLADYIYNNFTYRQGVTTIESTVDEIWKLKAGVCQDFAHLLIAMLRSLQIPCRYISGYICPSKSEMRGEGATHAWVEVYIPELGWRGIDPTNNCWVNDKHIKIAYGRDFRDCTPVKGTYKGLSDHTLSVSVVITNEKGDEMSHKPTTATYTSVSPKNESDQNSYRHFLEMQQQQQQQ